MQISKIILLLTVVTFIGCATVPELRERASLAGEIAEKAGFTRDYIKAGDFTLMTYQRFSRLSNGINVYIEGDGSAWETKYILSNDPTPKNPLALKLAAVDPAENVVYIARPGQYSLSGVPECNSKYWSRARFSPEVINSFSRVIDLLKEESRAKYINLIGFSGGGAIAVLLASQRNDVASIRTVGGNLNPEAFCKFHHVSWLVDSMNPMDVAPYVANIPQHHFVGSRDTVVPVFITRSFVKQEGKQDSDEIVIVKGFTHTQGWQEQWKKLLLLNF